MTEETKEVESGVSEDMKAAAEADLKRLNEERENPTKLRTFSRGWVPSKLQVLDLYPFPREFLLDNISPTSYLAQPEGEITGNVETQTFSLIEERLKGLLFDAPGRPLEGGRALRTVKWLKPNGILAQIPFEGQINNQAAGDEEDALGVRKYERKGGVIFLDYETMFPVYCFSRNCWAAAMVPELVERYPQHRNVLGSGYCSREHFMFTEPNRSRRFFNEGGFGMFSEGATTSTSRR